MKKEKKEKEKSDWKKFVKGRVVSKKVLKPSRLTIVIPNREVESSWDEGSHFFKDVYDKEKRMFFK